MIHLGESALKRDKGILSFYECPNGHFTRRTFFPDGTEKTWRVATLHVF